MGKRDKLPFYSLQPQNVTHATGKLTASSFCMFVQLTCKRLSSARANYRYSNTELETLIPAHTINAMAMAKPSSNIHH
jgi:hypothetical protein